jgi:hypothetical protein
MDVWLQICCPLLRLHFGGYSVQWRQFHGYEAIHFFVLWQIYKIVAQAGKLEIL